MGSVDWYRNTRWDAETEAAFNKKLARSRSQKAQYLRIQGAILKDTYPDAAIRLLQRCIAEGEDFHIAHAHLDMALAHYVRGDIEAALVSLEAALEQQDRQPKFRTSAAYDYAFLVALHDQDERHDRALAALEREGEGFFAVMRFEAEAAKAMILMSRGQHAEAQQAAQAALAALAIEEEWIPGHPQVGVVPTVESPLLDRLRDIANRTFADEL